MGLNIEITCSGLDETIAKINVLNTKVIERVQTTIKESAEKVKQSAAERAPSASKTYTRKYGKIKTFAPGFLKAHMRMIYKPAQFSATVTYLGPAYFGKFVEFGTKTQSAQPFLGPAWQSEKQNFIDGIREAVDGETGKGL